MLLLNMLTFQEILEQCGLEGWPTAVSQGLTLLRTVVLAVVMKLTQVQWYNSRAAWACLGLIAQECTLYLIYSSITTLSLASSVQ
jgi:hypothetical protein